MNRPTLSLGLAIAILALFAHRANQAVGAPIQVVSPSKYADIEAPGAITDAWFKGRFQQVFPASDFRVSAAGLPAHYAIGVETER